MFVFRSLSLMLGRRRRRAPHTHAIHVIEPVTHPSRMKRRNLRKDENFFPNDQAEKKNDFKLTRKTQTHSNFHYAEYKDTISKQ